MENISQTHVVYPKEGKASLTFKKKKKSFQQTQKKHLTKPSHTPSKNSQQTAP